MKKQEYNFKKIEEKYQKIWEREKTFQVKKSNKEKYYVLEMYPYPSGSGLHVGHAFNYVIGDAYTRFKRMNNFNVLYSMGYDSFGLPAENAAIKAKTHPKTYTKKAVDNFMFQQKALGLSYDWSRTLTSMDPEYYKWNQYFFLKLMEKGLIYRKKAPVNFCPKCNTVLANEQVHNGFCWRHPETEVQEKQLEQWFIKTTAYADELLDQVEKLDWPQRIKIMQKNWIGKSHGTEINFKTENESWKVFTTRPDTIYGVTFMVISAQHSRLMDIVTEEQKPKVKKFLKKIKTLSEEDLEKEGVFTGNYAENPLTKEKVPIWVGNFVLAEYGSGMVMAVPAHDQRDFQFAKKYNLPIKQVIEGGNINQKAHTGEGKLINSDKFNGLNNKLAVEKITKYLQKNKQGKKSTQYKLKDWLVSRQRYWGTPIPIIYCDKCGIVPVPESQLPVLLPEKVKFGKGNPLTTNKSFLNTTCPKCKSKARRETDTMDTFFDSSWYFLRYTDNKNTKQPFNKDKINYWLPVDQYIGGAEHACMHLIYARFFTKALRDMNFLNFDEPFTSLFNQGMIHGSDGFVMAKSRGNIINPIDMIKKYGSDSLRMFLVSAASPESDFNWDDKGLESIHRFIIKIHNYFLTYKPVTSKQDKLTESKLNKTIKQITEHIQNFKYNLAIIELRIFFEFIDDKKVDKKTSESFLKLLSLFCPHLAEELWNKLGNKSLISTSNWPKQGKINENLLKQEEQIEKTISDIINILKILKDRKEGQKSRVNIYPIPPEKKLYEANKNKIQKSTNLKVQILDIKQAKTEGKTIKAKPGKPGILIE